MKKFVLDTSVVVKWFSLEEKSTEAEEILKKIEDKKIEVLLPELVKYELANAFLKGKQFSLRQAGIGLEVFYSLPVIFVSESFQIAKESYRLAEKFNLTYYDACFLALAKLRKIPLVTANPRHQRQIPGVKIISL